jgi:hypothetical protein
MEKIQIGQKYRLRNGLETSEIRLANNGTNYIFESEVIEPEHETPSIMAWNKNGRFLADGIESRLDIIEQTKP